MTSTHPTTTQITDVLTSLSLARSHLLDAIATMEQSGVPCARTVDGLSKMVAALVAEMQRLNEVRS